MSYTIEWLSNNTNTWPIYTAGTTSTNLIENNLYNGQVQGYSLPAGSYTYSVTTENDSNYYNAFQLLDRAGTLIVTLVGSTNPWSGQGPFTGSFTLPFQTTVYARMVDYYEYNTRCTLTLTNTPLPTVTYSKIGGSGAIAFSSLRSTVGPNDSNPVSLHTYGTQISRSGTVSVSNFYNQGPSIKPGFTFRVFLQGYFSDNVSWFSTYTETYMGTTTDMTNVSTATNTNIPVSGTLLHSVEWFGYFFAPVTGSYTFYLDSDDASYLWIGSTALAGYTTSNSIINDGGGHGITEVSGTISLTAGTYYPIRSQYGNGGGPYGYALSFTGPGISRTYNFNGYVFYSLGTNSAFPAESARTLKTTSGTNVDGVYYINVNGTSTPTYCLMDSKWNGGGWMMLMKATRGTTFQYSSTYWTDNTTTLNTGSTDRTDADAKFNVMNYAMLKDVMALWPDVGYTGGSISQTDSWSWMVNNWYSNGSRCTAITGFTTSRDSPTDTYPSTFPGYSSSIWSQQSGISRHVIGGGTHLPSTSGAYARWGFIFNNESDWQSIDVFGGIGMGYNSTWTYNASAGDFIGCCQSVTGLNRTMRVQLFGR